MKHFSAAEFVDALEGRLIGARRAHLDSCPACTERVRAMRIGIADARDADVPEPSPLLWDNLAARISDAVRETTPAPARWWRHPALAIACSVVIVAAVVVGIHDARGPQFVPTVVAPLDTPASVPADAALTDDAAWDLLTDVASTVQQNDPHAAPVSIRPSTVDRAVVDLSAAEREELRRLLEDEMKRSGN